MTLTASSWTSAGASAVALAIALALWYVASSALTWFRLRKFPGPTLATFSYLWIARKMRSGRMHRVATETQRQYGPIVRIGPNELLVYDPETIWHINSLRSGYGRGGWYEAMRFDFDGHSVFSEPDTALHDARKAQLASSYSARGGVDFESVVDTQVAVLVDLLERKYVQKPGDGAATIKMMDFGVLAKYFTTDVTTHACMGEPWGDLPTETDMYHFHEDSDTFVPAMHCIGMVPTLRSFFASPFFLALAGPKTTDTRGLGQFLGAAKREVEKRFSGDSKSEHNHRDMMADWIKRGLSPADCRREAALQVPAGTDTITTVMRGTMLHLLTSPTVYRKLKREIATAIKQGGISTPITNDEAKGLSYLQAVLHEGIRMVPATVLGFSKRVPPGGDTLCGEFVPGGTDIMVNHYEMLRNRAVFGEDADFFRPERFLECDEGTKARMLKVVDLSFGYGRWMCLGKALAWMEINKMLVELLRRFDFQVANPEEPWRCKSYSSFTIDRFWIRVMEGRIGEDD